MSPTFYREADLDLLRRDIDSFSVLRGNAGRGRGGKEEWSTGETSGVVEEKRVSELNSKKSSNPSNLTRSETNRGGRKCFKNLMDSSSTFVVTRRVQVIQRGLAFYTLRTSFTAACLCIRSSSATTCRFIEADQQLADAD